MVNFVGRFLAAVLPVLEHFSMETAIVHRLPRPLGLPCHGYRLCGSTA